MAYRAVLALWLLVLIAMVVGFSVGSGSPGLGILEGVLATGGAALMVGGTVAVLLAIARRALRLSRRGRGPRTSRS